MIAFRRLPWCMVAGSPSVRLALAA